MPKVLVASSPVEIEAKAEEAEFPQEAHDMARRMFHDLTDLLAKAAIALDVPHENWPKHSFYFGTSGPEMAAVLDGLSERADIIDVTNGIKKGPADISGLYVREEQPPFVGVLVAY